ncbi:MAG: DNA primase [Enterococcus sp.]|nr:DNA primase [Enterococcus sp.]
MARIPTQVIDEIRSRTNIVEIIGQYVQLKKSGGKNYVGLCPFHNEKSPSFSVAEDKQFYHCFGCGRGGNVFRFIEEIEGLPFHAAVLRVAELEGIPVEEKFFNHIEEKTSTTATNQLIVLHEKAAEIYHHLLMHTTAGQVALDYLLERGLTEETIVEFQIGFAPIQREFLEKVFLNEKLPKEHFASSGLFVEREDGQLLDRFYQRVVFPIRNAQGKTIGFSGRWLDLPDTSSENQAKYLNSPETAIFNKREVLFNFDKARSIIRKESEVYLFEGFMDVLAAWQAGVKNGIASMGTSLTQQQVQMIEKITKQLVFSYDGDSAGIEATNRGIELLKETSRLELSVLSFPERLDPDDYIRKYGQEAFVNLANHGRETIFSFKQAYHRMNRNLSNEKEQLEYLEILLLELVEVDSLIEQDRYLTQLSTEFQVSREVLQQQFRQLKQQHRVQRREKQQEPGSEVVIAQPIMPMQNRRKTQVEKAQEVLLYRLFHEEGFNQRFKNLDISFPKEQYQELYVLFDTYIAIESSFEIAKFFDFLQDENLRYLVAQIENLKVPEESSDQELRDLLKVIQNAGVQEEIQQKKLEQQMASQMGNQQRELELAVEILNLTKYLKKVQ